MGVGAGAGRAGAAYVCLVRGGRQGLGRGRAFADGGGCGYWSCLRRTGLDPHQYRGPLIDDHRGLPVDGGLPAARPAAGVDYCGCPGGEALGMRGCRWQDEGGRMKDEFYRGGRSRVAQRFGPWTRRGARGRRRKAKRSGGTSEGSASACHGLAGTPGPFVQHAIIPTAVAVC